MSIDPIELTSLFISLKQWKQAGGEKGPGIIERNEQKNWLFADLRIKETPSIDVVTREAEVNRLKQITQAIKTEMDAQNLSMISDIASKTIFSGTSNPKDEPIEKIIIELEGLIKAQESIGLDQVTKRFSRDELIKILKETSSYNRPFMATAKDTHKVNLLWYGYTPFGPKKSTLQEGEKPIRMLAKSYDYNTISKMNQEMQEAVKNGDINDKYYFEDIEKYAGAEKGRSRTEKLVYQSLDQIKPKEGEIIRITQPGNNDFYNNMQVAEIIKAIIKYGKEHRQKYSIQLCIMGLGGHPTTAAQFGFIKAIGDPKGRLEMLIKALKQEKISKEFVKKLITNAATKANVILPITFNSDIDKDPYKALNILLDNVNSLSLFAQIPQSNPIPLFNEKDEPINKIRKLKKAYLEGKIKLNELCSFIKKHLPKKTSNPNLISIKALIDQIEKNKQLGASDALWKELMGPSFLSIKSEDIYADTFVFLEGTPEAISMATAMEQLAFKKDDNIELTILGDNAKFDSSVKGSKVQLKLEPKSTNTGENMEKFKLTIPDEEHIYTTSPEGVKVKTGELIKKPVLFNVSGQTQATRQSDTSLSQLDGYYETLISIPYEINKNSYSAMTYDQIAVDAFSALAELARMLHYRLGEHFVSAQPVDHGLIDLTYKTYAQLINKTFEEVKKTPIKDIMAKFTEIFGKLEPIIPVINKRTEIVDGLIQSYSKSKFRLEFQTSIGKSEKDAQHVGISRTTLISFLKKIQARTGKVGKTLKAIKKCAKNVLGT